MSGISPASSPAKIHILGLCGSLRAQSYTRHAITKVLDAATQAGAHCQLLPASALRLPLCDGSQAPPAVNGLQQAVEQADAIVLGTPEYCGSLSAVIKNAIEWIGYERLCQKITGLVSVAAGASADGGLNALRQLCLCQGMWVVPAAAPVPLAERVFDTPDDAFSQLVLKHLDDLGSALPEAVRRISPLPDARRTAATGS